MWFVEVLIPEENSGSPPAAWGDSALPSPFLARGNRKAAEHIAHRYLEPSAGRLFRPVEPRFSSSLYLFLRRRRKHSSHIPNTLSTPTRGPFSSCGSPFCFVNAVIERLVLLSPVSLRNRVLANRKIPSFETCFISCHISNRRYLCSRTTKALQVLASAWALSSD